MYVIKDRIDPSIHEQRAGTWPMGPAHNHNTIGQASEPGASHLDLIESEPGRHGRCACLFFPFLFISSK
jgi:hypothetical protein